MVAINWNIFWIIFNIIVLFILLRIFLFKPLQKIAAKRETLIQGQIDNATKLNKEASTLKEQYENSLKNAKEESFQIVSDAKERAQTQYDHIIDKANEDAAQIKQQAQKATEAEHEQMMRSAKAELADIALAAASKVLGSNIDAGANKKLLDDFLAGEESSK